MNINSWLKTNTFHHSNFKDIGAIVAEKQKQKTTVSLCIPTLNEEATIGKEIIILKQLQLIMML